MSTPRIGYAIVVDDEPANRDFLERLMAMAGFEVKGAGTGKVALEAARSVPRMMLALIDQELPDATGIEIITQLRADFPDALLVMATMHDHRDLIDQAFEAGADVFLVKPHGFMELFRRLKESSANMAALRRLIIDQYGPRPYKGAKKPPVTGASKPASTAAPSAQAPFVPPSAASPATASPPAQPDATSTTTKPDITDPSLPTMQSKNS